MTIYLSGPGQMVQLAGQFLWQPELPKWVPQNQTAPLDCNTYYSDVLPHLCGERNEGKGSRKDEEGTRLWKTQLTSPREEHYKFNPIHPQPRPKPHLALCLRDKATDFSEGSQLLCHHLQKLPTYFPIPPPFCG